MANSINNILGNVNNISYTSLAKLADGTYNKGEIDLQKGFFGSYSFEKINNHVGFYANKNTVVRTEQQNLMTKAAVFRAIVTQFAGTDEAAHVRGVLENDSDTNEFQEALDSFKNPYISKAYEFLMNDGAPLTRDEMRFLDHKLKEAHEFIGKRTEGVEVRPPENSLEDGVNTLKFLHQFKMGDSGNMDNNSITRAEAWVKGLQVGNASSEVLGRVRGTSANVIANGASSNKRIAAVEVFLAKNMPELYNACVEKARKAGFPSSLTEESIREWAPELDAESTLFDELRNQPPAKQRKVTENILKWVRGLTAGIEDLLNKEWQKLPPTKQDEYSKDDIKARLCRMLAATVGHTFFLKTSLGERGLRERAFIRDVCQDAKETLDQFTKDTIKWIKDFDDTVVFVDVDDE